MHKFPARGSDGGIGKIIKELPLWSFLKENVEEYDLGELRLLGLLYTEEDVQEMR